MIVQRTKTIFEAEYNNNQGIIVHDWPTYE